MVLPIANPATPQRSSRLRRQVAVANDSGIAVSAVAIAYTVTVCPVAASLTPRSALMATRTPAGSASVSTVTNAASISAARAARGSRGPGSSVTGAGMVGVSDMRLGWDPHTYVRVHGHRE